MEGLEFLIGGNNQVYYSSDGSFSSGTMLSATATGEGYTSTLGKASWSSLFVVGAVVCLVRG